MSAGLKRRLETIEAGQPSPTLWGDFVHENGRPIKHDFWGERFDVERWFRTGELPQNVAFFVMCWTETQMGRYDDWEPFPTLHPGAVKLLGKIITFTETVSGPEYYFDGYVFRGIGGVLAPSEQRKELMPHG